MIKIEKEKEMLNAAIADDRFMDALNAKLGQLLDPDIEVFVSKEEFAGYIAEGDKINEERGGHKVEDVVVVTLNGVQYIS